MPTSPTGAHHDERLFPGDLPHAVIFDVDGTLLDSVDLHARAWVDALLRLWPPGLLR